MPAGLEVFDNRGWLTFQATDHLPRILGYDDNNPGVVGGGVGFSGSRTDARLTSGEGVPFFYFIPTGGDGIAGALYPTLSMSGNTVSWTYPSTSPFETTYYLLGVFIWGLN